MASKPYVVRPGDYLTSIAHRFSTTVDAILADPANAELRDKRHPEILAPGDIVYVAQGARTWLPVEVGTANVFVGTMVKVQIEVVLLGPDRKPLANRSVATTPSLGPLKTDNNGLLQCSVPISLGDIDAQIEGTNLHFRLRVGNLDPVETRSGLASRLRHLGHCGDEDEHIGARDWLSSLAPKLADHALRSSIMSFQRSTKQEPHGLADDDLRRAVVRAHGC